MRHTIDGPLDNYEPFQPFDFGPPEGDSDVSECSSASVEAKMQEGQAIGKLISNSCGEVLDICGKHLVCDKERGHTGDHSQAGENRWMNTGFNGETPKQKRNRSLTYAVEHAQRCASESGENCYILHSEIYANSYHEYDNIEHVVGTRGVFATMYDRWEHPAYNSKLVGVVSPNGQCFLNQVEDIYAQAERELSAPQPILAHSTGVLADAEESLSDWHRERDRIENERQAEMEAWAAQEQLQEETDDT